MEYETSYDTGAKPFVHDKHRGKWESSTDFLYACVGHAFRPEILTIIPLVIFQAVGIYALIPYFVVLAVCVVPIIFIQSFLGQFSGTGFISVFRIAPLFKGIGYVSLVVNFVNLTYYSVFSAIPLFYGFHSLRPTIPWSCEGVKDWLDENQTICSKSEYSGRKIPSIEFLRHHFHFTNRNLHETFFSIELMLCTVIVWGIVTFVLSKSTESIGRFMRYSLLTMVALLSLCLLRFIFLPGAVYGLLDFISPRSMDKNMEFIHLVPIMALSTLGPGWGSILTLASYNNFKTNVYKYSWLMCLAHVGIIIGMACMSSFIQYFIKSSGYTRPTNIRGKWTDYMTIPFGLTLMEWPNFWTLIYLTIVGLGALNILVIQLFSLLTSLFDEYENLREIKRHALFVIVGILLVTSMLFCSNHGVFFFEAISKFSALTQVVLNLLLIMVVLWVYGRERFQRDVHFMISQTYSTWMVFVVRFIAPLFLVFTVFIGFILTIISMIFHDDALASSGLFFCVTILFFLTAWCLIPCYCIAKIKKTVGSIGIRLKRCVRPTDWYPADPEYKQSYEERFSTTDMSHQLTVVSEEM